MQTTIEELKRKMIEEAKKKAEEIIKEAERKAEQIIAAAEAEWSKRAEKKREEILASAKIQAQIIISEARRKARLIASRKKYDIINQIYEKAWSIIRKRENINVESSLRYLLSEALNFIEKPKLIIVNPADKDIMVNIIRKRNINVNVSTDEKITGGLILVSEAGEKVDNTYDTRFRRAKEVLTPILVKILWG